MENIVLVSFRLNDLSNFSSSRIIVYLQAVWLINNRPTVSDAVEYGVEYNNNKYKATGTVFPAIEKGWPGH